MDTIKISHYEYERLQEIGEKYGRSVYELISFLLEDYLDELVESL